jgi:hypothetical protein
MAAMYANCKRFPTPENLTSERTQRRKVSSSKMAHRNFSSAYPVRFFYTFLSSFVYCSLSQRSLPLNSRGDFSDGESHIVEPLAEPFPTRLQLGHRYRVLAGQLLALKMAVDGLPTCVASFPPLSYV